MKKTLSAAVLLAAALILTACGGAEAPAGETGDAPSAPVGPLIISATGEVVPANDANVAFQLSGTIDELLVEVGDTVEEGDVLARLDTTIIESQVAQAEAGVALAEATLARTLAGATQQQIDEAEANLAAAAASTNIADAQRDLTENAITGAQIASAEAAVQQAFINQHFARIGAENGDANAQHRYENAVLAYQQAQAALDRLLSGIDENTADALDADVWAASADYLSTEASYDSVVSGSSAEAIAVAQAQVDSAQAALDRTRLQLEYAELRAPFSGTVGDIFIRESQYVNAGVPALTLADLTNLQVETTDLNEIDVADINEGDTADVTFDALPGNTVNGTLVSISPRAEEGTGVNFTVIIALDEVPEGLRWGMTAFVDIPIDQE